MERGSIQGARRRLIASGVAVVAGVLFMVAGWLSISAAELRWGDACDGGFDTSSCLLIQDHLYDYVLPTDPWVPIAGAAELAGLSYIVVALALALVFTVVRSPVWGWLLQVALVLSVLLFGVTTVMSGRAGIPLEPATSIARWLILVIMIGGPMALVAVAGLAKSGPAVDGLMPPLAWCLWTGLLLLATPIPEYFLIAAVVGYMSHDTTPWDGAASGVLFALAGVVLIAGVAWNAGRRTRVSSRRALTS